MSRVFVQLDARRERSVRRLSSIYIDWDNGGINYLFPHSSLSALSIIFASYNLNEYPTLKYGTAWKYDRTADLVTKAIKAGFRHIDTACQPRHYHEAGTGDGWIAAAKELGLTRADIWLQTKFSGLNAHDPNNVPYDVNASLEDRVRQSLKKSLENLKTDYIDSLIMHGPEDNWDDHWKVSKYCARKSLHEHALH